MRRTVAMCLSVVFLALSPRVFAADPWDALRQGGVVLLMRHAATEPGTGDPPDFRPGDCSTQRNLSAAGRLQAQRMGALLAARGVRPAAVFSSAWCRCLETAALAFPDIPAVNLPALDSLFMDSRRAPAQTAALREALGRIPRSGVTVWVTHQVNAGALTGEYPGMGEILVLRPQGTGKFLIVGRLLPPER